MNMLSRLAALFRRRERQPIALHPELLLAIRAVEVASQRRDTRAMGAAISRARQLRTDGLRAEVAAREQR